MLPCTLMRGVDAVRELGLLESAVDSLTPWFRNLGLSFSNPKSKLCVFSIRATNILEVIARVSWGANPRCS